MVRFNREVLFLLSTASGVFTASDKERSPAQARRRLQGAAPAPGPAPLPPTSTPSATPSVSPSTAPSQCGPCFTGNATALGELIHGSNSTSPGSIFNCGPDDFNFKVTAAFDITNKSFTIGPCGPGDGSFQFQGIDTNVFTSSAASTHNVTMIGVTFSNSGSGGELGGAILNLVGTLVLIDCTFRNNTAKTGGGIANEGGFLNIAGTTHFQSNSATVGGAILNLNGGTVNTAGTTLFQSNSASSYGGAIFNEQASLNIDSTALFLSNSANLDGGGIYNANVGTLNIAGTTQFHSNGARGGGGILNVGTLNIDGVAAFENNIVNPEDGGGGILCQGGVTSLLGNTSFVNSSTNAIRITNDASVVVNGTSTLFKDDKIVAIYVATGFLFLSKATFTNNTVNILVTRGGSYSCDMTSVFSNGASNPMDIQTNCAAMN